MGVGVQGKGRVTEEVELTKVYSQWEYIQELL
jgi:hypothetical protein